VADGRSGTVVPFRSEPEREAILTASFGSPFVLDLLSSERTRLAALPFAEFRIQPFSAEFGHELPEDCTTPVWTPQKKFLYVDGYHSLLQCCSRDPPPTSTVKNSAAVWSPAWMMTSKVGCAPNALMRSQSWLSGSKISETYRQSVRGDGSRKVKGLLARPLTCSGLISCSCSWNVYLWRGIAWLDDQALIRAWHMTLGGIRTGDVSGARRGRDLPDLAAIGMRSGRIRYLHLPFQTSAS